MSNEHTDSEKLPRSRVWMHWLLAASVLFLFVSSWWMLSLPLPSDEFTYRVLPFQLHKNIGLTLFLIVLFLAITRVLTTSDSTLERSRMQKLASIDHIIIYVLLILCCLSGYLSSSYSGWETSLWWLVDLPTWTEESDELNLMFSDIHMWSCWALLAVMGIHIGAALYHGLRDDGSINKMFRID